MDVYEQTFRINDWAVDKERINRLGDANRR